MGKINQGILGGVSGQVGNVIGGSWKGIDYLRIKPSSVANPKTEGQVNQRLKFKTALQFLQSMTDFIRVGFKQYANKMTQFNAAMSYNLNNAIGGTNPDFYIQYSAALVTRGTLTGADTPSVNAPIPTEVLVSWNDNSGIGSATAKDKALILIYNTARNESVYTTNGALRSVGQETLLIPADYQAEELEVYLSFISEDGTKVTNSVHIDTITP